MLSKIKSILDVKNVSFSFGATKVLNDISFSVLEGDFIGLIGQNGSGKTTLLNLILGLYSLKSGSIKIDGISISKFNKWNLIGYVPQKAMNISDNFPASVSEIVKSGLLSLKKFPRRFFSSDNNKVIEALKIVGMESFVNRRIGELSGGQQQRVLIARALISKPKLLIFDEPTSGVDLNTQNIFYDLLGKLNESGITIILVSHDHNRITNFVNKIASLSDTHLTFYNHHEDFCSHPKNDKDHHCLSLKRVCK